MIDREHMIGSAIMDFRRARQQASMGDIMASLTGRSNSLLSFDEVKHQLHAGVSGQRELKDIPLAAIVGSVGRYTDFTRQFLPRNNSAEDRWARVKTAMESQVGVPPIELYQIGNVYFVLDGNHRVSVARQSGATHIQAYVTKVHTRVLLSPDDSPDDLILKAEYTDFLERTQLDETRPGADLRVTEPGQYRAIELEIAAQRAALAAEQGNEVTFELAAASWYDTIYLPIIAIIRNQGLLHEFPGRTEADMYTWTVRHRAELERELGWNITPTAAASDLASRRGQNPRRIVARLGGRLLGAMTPTALEAGPAPGDWRKDRGAALAGTRLSADLLVPVSGEPNSWHALDQALVVAQREGGRIAGLHVVANASLWDGVGPQLVQAEFARRCQAAGVVGSLVVEIGAVTDTICDRARWNDLVVVNLAYPPGAVAVARLRSGFRSLIQRCPRPILVVPQAASPLSRALLAYDGSPKAHEALYVATYLSMQWNIPLAVIAVLEAGVTASDTLDYPRQYLEQHGVVATYLIESGRPAEAILRVAADQACDLILMGGYGFNPLLEIVIGSVVDQILRETRQPVLICR